MALRLLRNTRSNFGVRPPASFVISRVRFCSMAESAVPLLPSPEDVDIANQQLRVGEVKSFPELGPIVINRDGTTARITNWDTMTEMEQERTWRIISARNKARLDDLKVQMAAEIEKPAEQQE